MITKDLIHEKIKTLRTEQATLQASHDALVREHQSRTAKVQETIANNQSRFQQIAGAIAQLQELLNHEQPV